MIKYDLRYLINILVTILLCLASTYSTAQVSLVVPDIPTNKTNSADNSKEKASSIELKVVKKGVAQSRNLLGRTASTIGLGLDSLFGSPDKDQPNESAITLSSGFKFDESGSATQINGVNFQADLPATSSKLQLLIRVDDQNDLQDQKEDDSSDPDSGKPETPPSASFESRVLEANKAGIFVRYIYKAPDSPWQTTFDNGLQFATSSLAVEPVSYLRVGQTIQVGSWYFRPVPGVYWTESSGFGAGIALHTFKPIDQVTSLQHTTSIHYLLDSRNTHYQHGWQLVKVFSQDLRATYNITFYTTDEAENLIDEAQISATLRRRIDGDWLFFSVTPADTLSAEDDYEGNMSITFQLEAKFGTQY